MKQQSNRILSLDIFRGFTVILMIIVNNQWGPSFRALNHMSWNGCTPTDLVFPFFLFIVGVSMWFSYRKQNHELSREAVLRLLKRGALIWIVGFLLNWYPFYNFRAGEWALPSVWDWTGVLQRIGIAFFVGGVIALSLKTYRKLLITSFSILVGYWALINIFGDASYENFIGGRIDGFLLGQGWNSGFFSAEGFFSTIPAIATVLLGYTTGKFVGENRENKWKTLGGLGVAGGLMITLALMFNQACPINKPIWSSTYVLYTAGLAMQVWMLLLWIYDYKGKTFGRTVGVTFGTNALFAYVIATLINKTIRIPALLVTWQGNKVNIFHWLASWFGSWLTPEWGALMSSIVLIALLFAMVYPLWKRKIFIKL